MYRSKKTYGHERGFSVAFRQHGAKSHCRLLHGYALSIGFVFEAEALDDRNWVVDFGGMDTLKAQLEEIFDHKTIAAEDDPFIATFYDMHHAGIIALVTVKKSGCESFAEIAYNIGDRWLEDNGYKPRVRLVSTEVKEHGANGAIYFGPVSVRPEFNGKLFTIIND